MAGIFNHGRCQQYSFFEKQFMSQKRITKNITLSGFSGWFTLEEAAKKLSTILKENITTAGVLRLALSGNLKLSLNLPIPTPAKFAFEVAIEDESEKTKIPKYLFLPPPKDNYYLKIEPEKGKKFVNIEGIFDLPMIFGERSAAQAEYSRKENQISVDLLNNKPIIVEKNGNLYCLQEIVNDPIDVPKSLGLGPFNWITGTYNAIDIPNHGSFIIRYEALENFEESIKSTTPDTETPLANNERTSLLLIIFALLKKSNIDLKGAATKIVQLTEESGHRVGVDAVRRALTKLNAVLEDRME